MEELYVINPKLHQSISTLFITMKEDSPSVALVKKNIEDLKNKACKAKFSLATVIDIPNENGDTLLSLAARNDYHNIVEILLESKANPNTTNWRGTPLTAAAYYGSRRLHEEPYTDTVKLLIKAKTNVNIQNKRGSTALWGAVSNNNQEIVKLLLEEKATVNVSEDGLPALHRAIENRNPAMVRMLLQEKANPNIINHKRETSLHRAAVICHPEIVRLLLQFKAEINPKGFWDTTPIEYVINERSQEEKILSKYCVDFGKTKLPPPSSCSVKIIYLVIYQIWSWAIIGIKQSIKTKSSHPKM